MIRRNAKCSTPAVVRGLLSIPRGKKRMAKFKFQYLAFSLAAAVSLSAQSDRVPAGTEVTVRTNESIDGRSPSDFRVYTATVERDVTSRTGQVLIPRGSQAELILRDADSDNVVVDLESISVNGDRLAVVSAPETVPAASAGKDGVGANRRTGKYLGGGAVIGAIIGAVAGGGKGAAIGAATGAGAGAVGQTVTRGHNVRLPAESLVSFRLDRSLNVGGADQGTTQRRTSLSRLLWGPALIPSVMSSPARNVGARRVACCPN